MLEKLRNYVRGKDEIVKPSHTRLNFMGDVKQKTFVGGMLSIFIGLYVLYIALDRGLTMVLRHDPAIKS